MNNNEWCCVKIMLLFLWIRNAKIFLYITNIHFIQNFKNAYFFCLIFCCLIFRTNCIFYTPKKIKDVKIYLKYF